MITRQCPSLDCTAFITVSVNLNMAITPMRMELPCKYFTKPTYSFAVFDLHVRGARDRQSSDNQHHYLDLGHAL